MSDWPKGPTIWYKDRVMYVSIPFTWNLPQVRDDVLQTDFWRDRVVVGGPAMKLIPDYFNDLDFVTVGDHCAGVLQIINSKATRTTLGCPNRCGFCAVPRIEGRFRELGNWLDLPVICDNNLLAASESHLNKVFDRLEAAGLTDVDFNQGLDARLLREWHAERLARLVRPRIRLACDSIAQLEQWGRAVDLLRSAGISKNRISTYALIGWADTPKEAWHRCQAIRKRAKYVCPMWFHELDAMKANEITTVQWANGWNDDERTAIMGHYYKHRGQPRYQPITVSPKTTNLFEEEI